MVHIKKKSLKKNLRELVAKEVDFAQFLIE